MNQLEMEKQFDRIYQEAIPLVLFSTGSDRKDYGNLLSSLFILYRKGNALAFNEAYDLLVKKLNDKQKYDRHQEENIKSFHNLYLSFDQRMENIEKNYLEFKSMVNQINKDHINLKNLAITSRSHGAFIREFKKQSLHFKKDENVVIGKPSTCIKKPNGISVVCSKCGHSWMFKGTGNRATCIKCKKTFYAKEGRETL